MSELDVIKHLVSEDHLEAVRKKYRCLRPGEERFEYLYVVAEIKAILDGQIVLPEAKMFEED